MIVLEAALLIESGYQDVYDELWYIYVNQETRYERLWKGRGYTKEKTDSIMKNQLSEEEFREHAHFVIDNSYDIANTKEQIQKILMQNYLKACDIMANSICKGMREYEIDQYSQWKQWKLYLRWQ